MRNLSIASITVSYNGAEMLDRQLDALFRQTQALREVIVVDNGSTDDTRSMLAAKYPQVKVLVIGENISPGAALSSAMAYAAQEKRHDWIWIFDVDSVPEPSTLQMLLNGLDAAGLNGQVGMVSPLLIHGETGECYPPLYWQDGFVKPSVEALQQSILFVDMVLGSGMLIRREVVEAIGPLREEMVMYFQDFDYCLRARKLGYKIAVVTSARLDHEVGHARAVRLPGFPVLWSVHAPWQEYYMARNLVYAAWHLHANTKTKMFAFRHLAKHAVGVVLFSPNKIDCLTKMTQGFLDGRLALLGQRFPLR